MCVCVCVCMCKNMKKQNIQMISLFIIEYYATLKELPFFYQTIIMATLICDASKESHLNVEDETKKIKNFVAFSYCW